MINKIKNIINKKNLDGYVVPKNDKFFTEYSKISNLELVSNFSGSAGFAIILKNKNFLFVDGRYTIQAKNQSGKKFKVFTIPNKFPKDVLKTNKKIILGFDPKLHTEKQLNFLLNVRDEVSRANQTIVDIRKVKNDLDYLLTKVSDNPQIVNIINDFRNFPNIL